MRVGGHVVARAFVALGLYSTSQVAVAQTPASQPTRAELESRADLEAKLRTADSAKRSAEAFLLRNRLERGDFNVGDKISLTVEQPPPGVKVADTLTVHSGKVLQFDMIPGVPDLSLDGVLRSELSDALRKHISRFYKDPIVRAMPLLRIQVSGKVVRQGFYSVPADRLLSDVIMMAGGPALDSELKRSKILRGTSVFLADRDVEIAINEGLTLDRLNLVDNDELQVGAKKTVGWANALQLAGWALTLYLTIRRVAR
jgi:hypothetical protein